MPPSKITVIIDGTNAINLMNFFKENAGLSLQAKQEKLAGMAVYLAVQTDKRYIIIFDGYNSAGKTVKYGADVLVMFSQNKIADAIIEKMSFDSHPARLEIVSSDNHVLNVCRNRGARVFKIGEFEKQYDFLNDRLNSNFIKEKGGKTAEGGDTLGEMIGDRAAGALNAMAEAKRKAETDRKKKEEQRKKAEAAKPPVKKFEITDEGADEFAAMFSGDRKIKSKTFDFDSVKDTEKTAKKNKPAAAPPDKKSAGPSSKIKKPSSSDENFDWTKYIDESFGGMKGKR